MTTYRVVRFFQNPEAPSHRKVVKRGLSRAEAQEHCRDPETSSRTCKLSENRHRTDQWGPWFDGWEEE